MPQKKTFSGYLGDCSPEQLQILAQFRNKVVEMGCSNPPYDDAYLLRFLRARKFVLKDTIEMWTNYINWRKEKQVNEICKMEIPEMNEAKQYYPHLWFRTDKLGRPIFIERVGKVNFDKLMKIVSLERVEQHFIQDYERLIHEIFPACSKAKGEVIQNTCYIMDMKGAAAKMMSSKVWDLLKMVSKIGQDYYPEILGHMFIINVPLFFYGIWNVVKHFVDDKTRKKIHILGSGYKKELFQYVDEKDLPDFLGGKATADDYGINLTNEQGPWVNESNNNSPSHEIQRKISTEAGDERPSLILDAGILDNVPENGDMRTKSVPILPKSSTSIESLNELEGFDIAVESPIKVRVKNLQTKPASMSFNMLPNGIRSFGVI